MHYRITYTGVGDLRLLAPATCACPRVPPPPPSGVAPGGPSIPEPDAASGPAPDATEQDEEAGTDGP